jgi:hypothetical protein
MSCSKISATNYLIDKGLVKPNMELYDSTPTQRLVKTIDRLTKRAKTTYGVDMGDLFTIRFRNVDAGNYLNTGSAVPSSKARLEANMPAFEAIDRSPAQIILNQQRQLDERRLEKQSQITVENEQINDEGDYIVNEDYSLFSKPTSLPEINITC